MRRSPVVSALERHYSDTSGELHQIEAEIVHSGHFGDALPERMKPETAQREEVRYPRLGQGKAAPR